ncbi:unnamed protein product [Cyprideis torosa]|uniref:Uncharacterized protein n=1 Tax=Cyprideis torosa TaxID=163714 RepID=A0A7R8W5M6_9CRUS|nr:unnamed protein product [Cyprideis torosa]CAG0883071.1 unnamed protein product [Cyprideis torosa]
MRRGNRVAKAAGAGWQSTGNILNFCNVGLKISGPTPITNTAALEVRDASVTAIGAGTIEAHTVAFLGTGEGYLKKVSVLTASQRPIKPRPRQLSP